MGISVARPIPTQKKTPMTIFDRDIHPLNTGKKIAVIIHIYGARSIFLLFYDSKTLNLSNVEYKIILTDIHP